jgi:hypothetical protein
MQLTPAGAAAPAPDLPKPSLLARKDIRDAFDAVLPDLTKTINDLLHESAYTVVNWRQVFAHCVAVDSGQNSIGSYAKSYLKAFVQYLKKYTEDVRRFLVLGFWLWGGRR